MAMVAVDYFDGKGIVISDGVSDGCDGHHLMVRCGLKSSSREKGVHVRKWGDRVL